RGNAVCASLFSPKPAAAKDEGYALSVSPSLALSAHVLSLQFVVPVPD
ncbi:unnamed protein product, partial [Urochloa humidicola]